MQRLFTILESYRPSPYDGRVLLYQARTEPLYHLFEVDKIWRHLAKEVEVVSVSGTHISLIQPPHVEALATHLRRRLRPGSHD
jgi:thioesterase domain-containing protein